MTQEQSFVINQREWSPPEHFVKWIDDDCKEIRGYYEEIELPWNNRTYVTDERFFGKTSVDQWFALILLIDEPRIDKVKRSMKILIIQLLLVHGNAVYSKTLYR